MKSIMFVIGLIGLVVAFALLRTENRKENDAMNSLMVIVPYKYEGLWVFDDAAVGRSLKPFTDEEFLAAVPNRHIKAELGYSVRPFRAFDRVVLASALVFSIMRVAAADEAAKAPEEMIWISGGEFEMGVVVW